MRRTSRRSRIGSGISLVVMVTLIATLPGSPSAVAAEAIPGLPDSDLKFIKSNPVPDDGLVQTEFPAKPLEDSIDDLPEGSAEVDVADPWAEVDGVPVEVRTTEDVTVLPDDPDDLATTESVPNEELPDASTTAPVEVSVERSSPDSTPGLLLSLSSEDTNPPEPGSGTSAERMAFRTTDEQEGPSPSEAPTAPESSEPSASPVDPVPSATPTEPVPDTETEIPSPEIADEGDEPDEVRAVEVRVSYEDFRYAFAGDWGSRLQVWAYPACFAETPQLEECGEGVLVPSTNDPVAETVTFTSLNLNESAAEAESGASPSGANNAAGQRAAALAPAAVGAAGGGVVYAMSASATGETGDYAATPFSPSLGWQVGESSGEFNYSYPIAMPPPAVAGPTPSLSLGYSSGSVDGMTKAENGQASMAGIGWDFDPGHITRRYAKCADDGLPTKGDLCWKTLEGRRIEETSIVLNGRSTTLIKIEDGDSSVNDLYRLADDPAWRVERVGEGTPEAGDPNNDDNNNEAFKVSDPDGTTYWFGMEADSVLTVPVYGNDTGEPCATASGGFCMQGYEWKLDRVVDRNSNQINYSYAREKNFYSRYGNVANKQEYDRGGYLTGITYGKARSTAGAVADVTTVTVGNELRCAPRTTNPSASCTGVDGPKYNSEIWPDVPSNLICYDDDTCSNYSPSFFSTRRYDSVTTSRVFDTGTAFVDKYQFGFVFPEPEPSDPGVYDLWLDKVTRIGSPGTATPITLPAVEFNGSARRNRVIVPSGGKGFYKKRVKTIRSETGGRIDVEYGHGDGRTCGTGSGEHMPSGRSSSVYECFPQRLNGSYEWWNKYVVTRIGLGDDALGYYLGQGATGNPNEGRLRIFEYEYEGAPGWRFRNNSMVPNDDETWDDWRGYQRVLIRQRKVQTNMQPDGNLDVSKRRVITFRGLEGTRLNESSPTDVRTNIVVPTTKGDYHDSLWLAGRVAEEWVFDANGAALSVAHTKYGAVVTAPNSARFEQDATYVYPMETFEKPRYGGPERIVKTTINTGSGDVDRTLLGTVARVVDDQGTAATADDLATCTKWQAGSANDSALRVAYETEVKSVLPLCTDSGATVHRRSQSFYDTGGVLGAAPSKGNLTKAVSYSTGTQKITTTTEYDSVYGRPTAVSNPTYGASSPLMTTTEYNPGGSVHNILVSVRTTSPAAEYGARPLTSTSTLDHRRGLPTSIVDANGQTTGVVLDGLGRPTAVNLPGKPATSTPSIAYQYGISNVNPSSIRTTRLRGDSTGAPLTTDVTYDLYDGWGRAIESQQLATNGANRILTATGYDDRGLPYVTVLPAPVAGATFGHVNPSFGSTNHRTMTEYDGANRPVKIRDLSGSAINSYTTHKYAVSGSNLVDTVHAYPNDTSTSALSKTVTVSDPLGRPTQVTQFADAASADAALSDPVKDGIARYTYTPTGELAKIVQPMTPTTSLDYNYSYDMLGRRKTASDPDTGATKYNYDEFGNITRTDDPMDNPSVGVIENRYDNLGRPTKREQVRLSDDTVLGTPTTLATWKYGDADGTALTDPPSVPNSQGQLIQTTAYNPGFGATTDPDEGKFTSSVTEFDPRGNPLTTKVAYPPSLLGEPGASEKTFSFKYNHANQVVEQSLPAAGGLAAKTAQVTYTTGGLFANMVLNDGQVPGLAGYDILNRPAVMLSGANIYDTNALGRSYAWGNNDRLNTLLEYTGPGADQYQVRYDYQYDALGNPLKITSFRMDTPTTPLYAGYSCYSYDGISRLTRAATGTNDTCTVDSGGENLTKTVGARYDLGYTYDRGRLNTVTNATSGKTATYGYTTGLTAPAVHAPRTISVSAGTGSTTGVPPAGALGGYDAGGRAGSWTPTTGPALAYTYNLQGNLTQTVQGSITPSNTTKYAYNADGTRIARKDGTANATLYLGDTEIIKTGSTPTARRNFSTPNGTPLGVETNVGTTWILSDLQNSVRFTKASGTQTVQYHSYLPYGEPISDAASLPGERGYLDKPHDPNGEVRLDQRSYDPSINTLTTPDPLLDLSDPQNLNAYAYSGNNPITFSDPTGLRRDDQDVPGSGNDRDFSSGSNPPPTRHEVDEETANIYERNSQPGEHGSRITKKVAFHMTDDGVEMIVASTAHDACRKNLGNGCSLRVLDILWQRWIKVLEPSALMGPPNGNLGAGAAGLRGVATGKPATGACSFSGSTVVLMADGSRKPIDEVVVGDKVIATDPETGEQVAKTVEHVFVHEDIVTDLVIDGEVITTTEDHPFWSVTDQRFERADELVAGEKVLGADGRTINVAGFKLGTAREALAYNLSIEGIHTYHVGDGAVLVHNESTCGRALWSITDAKSLKSTVVGDRKYSKQADGTWWSRDTAGHAGSAWKVYREVPGGLKWYRDADKYGTYIDPAQKHKSDVGTIVRW